MTGAKKIERGTENRSNKFNQDKRQELSQKIEEKTKLHVNFNIEICSTTKEDSWESGTSSHLYGQHKGSCSTSHPQLNENRIVHSSSIYKS